MNLPFSLALNGRRTYFPEKILGSIEMNDPEKDEFLTQMIGHPDLHPDVFLNCAPKIHTIREDEKDRWKVGMKIHFVIHNRSKKRYQFAPIREVKGIQEITISPRYIQTSITDEEFPLVVVDGEQLNFFEVQALAINDGFQSVEEFTEYFKEDFKGKLIHWTNFKY